MKYTTFTDKLKSITGTYLQRITASGLAGVRKRVGNDLVEYPGLPEYVFLQSEMGAAEMRAECMGSKIEDLVCTLTCKTVYDHCRPQGVLYAEPVLYSQLNGRIAELRERCMGKSAAFPAIEFKVMMAYSEETRQMFWWNDLELNIKPRMPGYNQKYESKRKGYRRSDSGVMR